jgi:hypothetical protein
LLHDHLAFCAGEGLGSLAVDRDHPLIPFFPTRRDL